MTRFLKKYSRQLHAFAMASLTVAALNLPAFLAPDSLNYFAGEAIDRGSLISYAPEVWLALLAFVFGTLIIVITIASENTPKLIDLFVHDYKSLFYIWMITLCILENIYLQLIHTRSSLYLDNLIFINNYCLLPLFIFIAIPYIFYILRYTKSSNVIDKIFDENQAAIREAKQLGDSPQKVSDNHQVAFATINQLQDLLQYEQFKEARAEIIAKFGTSLRFYLESKQSFEVRYFRLSFAVRNDISFKTLQEKFADIEKGKTFYEQKVLNAFATSYQLCIQKSLFDLASLCGNELYESGKTAMKTGDQPALDLIIIHFNTLIRLGINQGLKSKEIRNVYNMIFYYTRLVHALIGRRDEEKIIQCCRHFVFYGNELGKLSASDQVFIFLHDALATGVRKILFELFSNNLTRQTQMTVLLMFNGLCSQEMARMTGIYGLDYSNIRVIQFGVCLFYIEHRENEFKEITTEAVIRDLRNLEPDVARKVVNSCCDRIGEEPENFWEETDQGNQNIFYSPYKNLLPDLNKHLLSQLQG